VEVLLLGPYVGSFKEEVLNFRPYARWLYDVLDYDEVYLNTHSNRKFLYYDFIDPSHIIPIFENISRDELSQVGYIHEEIDQKDYNLISRGIKDHIADIENVNKRDIKQHSINYIKSTPQIEIHKKRFEKIVLDKNSDKYKNKIVFIPDETGSKRILKSIKEYLELENLDFVIAGDRRTYFQNENIVLNRVDYFEKGWRMNLQLITDAKLVITPISHWATLSNLQSVPLFTWGENIGQYREDGIYHFGNKICLSFPADGDTNIDSIIGMLNYFIKEIRNEI